MDIWIYVWLAVTAVAMIVEFLTSELVSVWFIGGGIVAIILAAVGLEWYVHLPVFIVLSIILMLCFRSVIKKKLNSQTVLTNAETVIGETFVLIKGITFDSVGEIKIGDIIWSATTENKTEIAAGKKVKILRIEGNKYIVEEIE